MSARRILIWVFRIITLIVLYIPIWILGSLAISGLLPETESEPGLVDSFTGMVILSVLNTTLIIALLISSRWNGWKQWFLLGLAYYGSFTFLTQIETWYFLGSITVSSELLPGLFIMGLSIPVLFIPIAIFICGKWNKNFTVWETKNQMIPTGQLFLKLGIISVIYFLIYWSAGYFIAWQNQELREFYGSPGEIAPFWNHTAATLGNNPGLIPFQLIRGIFFAFIGMIVMRGSKLNPWLTGVLVAFLLSFPHLVHILPNPLMPVASVRLSHMIETFTSTFLFGLIIVWLFHRSHSDFKDLFGLK